jgi:hypothetical protein
MYDPAFSVHIVETEENLLCDLFDEVGWDAFRLMSLYQAKKVLAEDFEHHANVCAVWSFVFEVIEKGDDMRTSRMQGIGGDESLKEFYLIQRGFCISRSRFDDLEGDVAVHPAAGR